MEWRKKVKKFPIPWGSAKLRSLEGDHSIWAKAWAAAAPSQIPMSSQHELRKPFCLKMLPAHLTWLPTSPPSCFFIILHRKTGKLGSQTRQGEEAGTLGRPGERFASCHVSERGLLIFRREQLRFQPCCHALCLLNCTETKQTQI